MMSEIDPVNGCPRCGLATCDVRAAEAARKAIKQGDVVPYRAARDRLYAAITECQARPPAPWQAIAAAAVTERDESRRERDAEASARERLSALLEATATALKGPPSDLQLHGWADHPAFAAMLVAESRRLRTANEEGRAGFKRVCEERDRLAARQVTPEMVIALLKAVYKLRVGDAIAAIDRHVAQPDRAPLWIQIRDRGIPWFIGHATLPTGTAAIRRDLAALVIERAGLGGQQGGSK